MKAIRQKINDLIVFEPDFGIDEHGRLLDVLDASTLSQFVGRPISLVQENQSMSHKGVLRGLHYQVAPSEQGKLISVVRGAIFDVAVDIRPESETYQQWGSTILSAANRLSMWIPEGFAHGFLALEEATEVLYKTTRFYDPATERQIAWNDPSIGIEWPLRDVLLSKKDASAATLA